jgi:hypothetical protein
MANILEKRNWQGQGNKIVFNNTGFVRWQESNPGLSPCFPSEAPGLRPRTLSGHHDRLPGDILCEEGESMKETGFPAFLQQLY